MCAQDLDHPLPVFRSTSILPMSAEWSDIKFNQIGAHHVDSDVDRGGALERIGSFFPTVPHSESRNGTRSLQKCLTYTLIGSISLGAFLGIICIFFNIEDPFTYRLMSTNWVAALFSLLGMACEAASTSLKTRQEMLLFTVDNDKAPCQVVKELFWVPKAGLVLSMLTAFLLIIPIWFARTNEIPRYWEVSGVVFIFTVAAVHICLLSMATLPRRFEILFWIAVQIILVMATVLSVNLFYPIFDYMGEFLTRLLAALGVCDLAITSVIPMLHRIGIIEAAEAVELAQQGANPSLFALEQEIVAAQQQLDRLVRMRAQIQQQQTTSHV